MNDLTLQCENIVWKQGKGWLVAKTKPIKSFKELQNIRLSDNKTVDIWLFFTSKKSNFKCFSLIIKAWTRVGRRLPRWYSGKEPTCQWRSHGRLREDTWRRAWQPTPISLGFLGGSVGKESAWNAGDPGSIHGSGSSLGGGHGYPLQYACLENPMDRGAWRATVPGVAKSQTRLEWLEHARRVERG